MTIRSTTRTALTACLMIAGACAGSGPNQTATPTVPGLAQPGDSVVYIATSSTTMRVHGRSGPVQASIRWTAVPHLVRLAGDSLRGSFEALSLRSQSPSGDMRPDTDPLLHLPFVLVEDEGTLRAARTPDVPVDIARLVDVPRIFEELLPAGFDLGARHEAGASWTDTVRTRDRDIGRGRTTRTAIRRYQVRGDTVHAGVPAIALDYTADMHIVTTATTRGAAELASVLEGTERGRIVYAPTRRLLLDWTRRAELAGSTQAMGQDSAEAFAQNYDYENSTRLLTEDAIAGAGADSAALRRATPALE